MKIARIDRYPELQDSLAEGYAQGMSQPELAELCGVSDRGTIAEWLKRADIKAKIHVAIKDRSARILRHTDSRVEKYLAAHPKVGIETLLKIRREYAGASLTLKEDGDKSGAVTELMVALHDHPELADAFKAPADAEPNST